VEYDIVFSQSYQVPVLYFQVKHSGTAILDLEFIYNHIVPHIKTSELQSISVMGGITTTVGFA
jgi:ubiquitin-like-conjugating enzyme ATG10